MTPESNTPGPNAQPPDDKLPPDKSPPDKSHPEQLHRERLELLRRLDLLTDKPMIALSFVWLGLLIVDFTRGLTPPLQLLSNVIWGVFVLDFALSFSVAPDKGRYLRHNWLTVVSLLLPALRVLRAFRALRALRVLRATRGINALRLVTSLNRGLRAAGAAVRRRGVGYVALFTAILIFGGAAGMYAFEASADGFRNYWDALWWTAMLMTTMGAAYSPVTPEGRFLTFVLAVYAFAVFGYITAAIASYFVGRDQEDHGPLPQKEGEADALGAQIASLRAELAAFRGALESRAEG